MLRALALAVLVFVLGLLALATPRSSRPRVLHTYQGMRLPAVPLTSVARSLQKQRFTDSAHLLARSPSQGSPQELFLRARHAAHTLEEVSPPGRNTFYGSPENWLSPKLPHAPGEEVLLSIRDGYLVRLPEAEEESPGWEFRSPEGETLLRVPRQGSLDLDRVQVLEAPTGEIAFLDPAGNLPSPEQARIRVFPRSFSSQGSQTAQWKLPPRTLFLDRKPEDPPLRLIHIESQADTIWIQEGELPQLTSWRKDGLLETLAIPELDPSTGPVAFVLYRKDMWWAIQNPRTPGGIASVAWNEPPYRGVLTFPPGVRIFDFDEGHWNLILSLEHPGQAGSPPTGEVQVLDLETRALLDSWKTPTPRRVQTLTWHLILEETEAGVALREAPVNPRLKPHFGSQGFLLFGFLFLGLIGLAGLFLIWTLFWALFGSSSTPTRARPRSRPQTRTPSGSTSDPAEAPAAPDPTGIAFLAKAPDRASRALPEEAPEILGIFLWMRTAEAARVAGELSQADYDGLGACARERVQACWTKLFPNHRDLHRAWIRGHVQGFAKFVPEEILAGLEELPPTQDGDPPLERGPLAQLARLHSLLLEAELIQRERDLPPRSLEPLRQELFDQAHEVLRAGVREGSLPRGSGGIETELSTWLALLDPEARLGRGLREELLSRVRAEAREVFGNFEVRCRVCGESLEIRDGVACEACETPHHPDCWEYNQGCAVFACGSTRAYRAKADETP